jgi:ABC-2 type transport system permease protein
MRHERPREAARASYLMPHAWSLRITLAKLRPVNVASLTRLALVAFVFFAFLYGDYALFRRLFRAIVTVEEQTPFFALALLRNLLSMVFLVATVVLFSSSMTVAIGSLFTDLDLDIHHAAPKSKLRIAVSRWAKTLFQSATIVFLFLVPLFVAFEHQYPKPADFHPALLLNLALLLTIPVSLASTVILALVRWFPVRRVHQIVASLAVLVLTLAVIAFRMSRPERFFAEISTDDVARVLRSIELPSMTLYPSTTLAEVMARSGGFWVAPRILIVAAVSFALFVLAAKFWYFTAFVRARESMAPVAIGAAPATRALDRLVARADPPLRAMFSKEVRTVTRDVAQWSQVFLTMALLFIYLYNIRMLPLGGDARATFIAYANLGMAGFVIAAICLRFAYPSVSSEGKAFWIVQTAPVSFRQFLIVKVLVYAAPLTLLSLVLTAFANVILSANAVVWTFTLLGASLLAVTLVSLGVGMGAWAPNFNAENPLQVGLSLGGFAYMAVSMGYVGAMMLLMARPVMKYFIERVLLGGNEGSGIAAAAAIVTALTLSLAVGVIPLFAAERRLTRLSESD